MKFRTFLLRSALDIARSGGPPSADLLSLRRMGPSSLGAVLIEFHPLAKATLRYYPYLIWLLCLGVVLSFAGAPAFYGSTEAREAHVAQVILNTGDWVLPTRNGLVPSKPLLQHWLTALLGLGLGGVDEFVARIPPVFFGCGIVLLTIWRLLGLVRSTRRLALISERNLALLGAGMLLSIFGFAPLLIDARVDVTCTFFMVAATFSLLARFDPVAGQTNPSGANFRERDFLLFYFLCGLGVLAKGPLGIVLPVLLVGCAAWSLLGLRAAVALFARPRLGWLVFLLLSVPWYVLAARAGSSGFIDRQLIFENVHRFFGGEHVNQEAWWFYLPSFLRQAFPLSVGFIYFAARSWRELRAEPEVGNLGMKESRALRLRLAYVVAFVAGLILFSAAAGKRHSYLLPLYPLMVVFLGAALSEWYPTQSARLQLRLTQALDALCWLLLWICFLLFLVLGSLPLYLEPLKIAALNPRLGACLEWLLGNYFVAKIIFGLFGAAALGLKLRRLDRSCLRLSGLLAFVSIMYFIFSVGFGVKGLSKSYAQMARIVNQRVARDESLHVIRDRFDEHFDPLLYYLGRSVQLVDPQVGHKVCALDAAESLAWIIARDDFVRGLKQAGCTIIEPQRLVEYFAALQHDRADADWLFTCECAAYDKDE